MAHNLDRENLSQSQAADLLGCTDRHIRDLIARGDLPAYKVGSTRTVRIKRSDLDALLRRIPVTAGHDVA